MAAPKRVMVAVRLSPAVRLALKVRAAKTGQAVQDLVEQAVRAYLGMSKGKD